jgi:type VI secretion system secreted protein VgrG
MDWLSLISQKRRLISIETALPEAMIVERFNGREAASELFQFTVDCLSASAFLDLDALLGQEVTLRILLADGGSRAWHGIVTQSSQLGSDGGLARYRLVIEPWLALWRWRRNSIIFQDLTVTEILEQMIADDSQAALKLDVSASLRKRAICTQYRETDLDFITRLLADEGLAFRFEHEQAEEDASTTEQNGNAPHSRHTLVVFDANAELPTAKKPNIRFHRVSATETEDAITVFTEQRQVTPIAAGISAWRADRVSAPSSIFEAPVDALPKLEFLEAMRAGHATETADSERLAEARLLALTLPSRAFGGSGSDRMMAPVSVFNLTDHDQFEANSFVPISVEHSAANNLGAEAAKLLRSTDIEAGSYRNQFLCAPAGIAIVPRLPARPTAPGPQLGRVVGLQDGPLTSTRDHQVRVQFAWQRGNSPNPGGLSDTGSTNNTEGHAPGDHTSGTWVRISEALAGPNWGSVFVPRIGAEVIVSFLNGDIDQPVITAQLYTPEQLPPWSAGVDSSANHPGTISGIATQAIDGAGHNRWIMDDAPGQLRQQIDTHLADTSLALGYLIDQSGAVRGKFRGEGFEARTQAWGAIRSNQGMLISTTARAQAQETVMITTEAQAQWQGAVDTVTRLNDAAKARTAQAFKTLDDVKELRGTFDPEQLGKFAATVNAQEATRPSGDKRSGGDAVEAFAKPTIMMEAPSTIAWATPASMVAFAGEHQSITSQADTQFTAAHTLAIASGQGASLFSHEGPLHAIAANGPVSIQAHTNQMELLSDQSMTVTATDEGIDILAKDHIILTAGKTQITLKGGDITLACPGKFTVKASKHPFSAGESKKAELVKLPDTQVKMFDEQFLIQNSDGEPIPELPYKITTAEGDIYRGITDENGYSERIFTAAVSQLKIEPDDSNFLEMSGSYDEQIQFLNANGAILANVNYSLLLSDGSTVNGTTDDEGKTTRILSKAAQKIKEAKLTPAKSIGCCAANATGLEEAEPLSIKLSDVITNQEDVGESVKQVRTPKGKSRGLTDGEIIMAKQLFKDSIDYSKVKIHNGEYVLFGMQPNDTAITPNGEIYLNTKHFSEDFSLESPHYKWWIMHEMVHVWQYQLGYSVLFRALISLGQLSYKYDVFERNKHLSSYNQEAQGDLLADYWTLKYQPGEEVGSKCIVPSRMDLYEEVLNEFIINPKDKAHLHRPRNYNHTQSNRE